MKFRKLGKKGPLVSALGLGCMTMTESYGPTNEKSGLETIEIAYENGVTFFDTADMYGSGANEKLVGKAIKHFRKKIVIATKCGIEYVDQGLKINNTPQYILKACENSLKRLEIDVIDLYYLHRYNPEIPIEESMQAMLKLIEEGKILHVGLSEVDGPTLERAHRLLGDKLVAVQTEYSILNRSVAEAILPTCRKLGVAFVAYSPIGRGLLSGKIKDSKIFSASSEFDFRSMLPQFQSEAFKDNLGLVEAITALSKMKNCTPAQLALAWLLAQGEDIIPIPGTKHAEYLTENLQALNIILSPNDLKMIDEAIRQNPVKGNRLPEELLKVFHLSQ